MIFMVSIGGVIAAVIVAGAVYDYRARRRGWRVNPSTDEAFQNRLDIKATDSPFLQGGTQDWMTYRQRDRD
jgi:hypothetical protein